MGRRRWFQFSLRTAFVVVTIGCVWLASIAQQAGKEREALAAIHRADGDVVYEPTFFSQVGLGRGRPSAVSFPFSNVEEIGFDKLPWLRTLRRLDLKGTNTRDKHLRHLAAMTHLEAIDVSRTLVSRRGLEQLERALPNAAIASDYWCGVIVDVTIVERPTTVESNDVIPNLIAWEPKAYKKEEAKEEAALLNSLGPSLEECNE